MIKVAILGPESTGKSELAKSLAIHYSTIWIPEYAREYVEKLNSPYTYEDICRIAKTQIEQQQEYEDSTAGNFIFFDTDLIITKVWFEHCYKKVPEFVVERMSTNYFDFYMLCAPDLPWIPDPVREHGDDREYFFNWYLAEIEQTQKPYVIISDIGAQRLQNAIAALNQFKLKTNCL